MFEHHPFIFISKHAVPHLGGWGFDIFKSFFIVVFGVRAHASTQQIILSIYDGNDNFTICA